MQPPWVTPVRVEGALRARVDAQVERLSAHVFARWEQETQSFGFTQGKVGLAFVAFELAAAGVPDAEEHADRLTSAAVDHFNTWGAGPGLHTGIAGLGWLVDAWVGEEDLLGPIDDSLRERVSQWKEPTPNIGLRAGFAGIGLYAARRAARAASGQALLDEVKRVATRAARATDLGTTFDTPLAYYQGRIPKGEVADPADEPVREWGMAHGVTPVAVWLAHLGPASPVPVTEVLRWVWSSTTPQANRFGMMTLNGRPRVLNVFTWCTGDAGVAFGSWFAARIAGDEAHATLALELAHSLARRVLSGERPGLPERLDLCCGLGGVLQCFASHAALSGDPLLADATQVVAKRLVDELEKVNLDELPLELQFGTAGLTAALLALSSGRPPSWAPLLALGPVGLGGR